MSERPLVDPRTLDRLLHPTSIAVVGASERPGFTSMILQNLIRYRGRDPIYPVNPRHRTVHGLACFPSVEALPVAPDLVLVGVPSQSVPAVLDECARRRVGSVQVISGGFAESGSEGARLQEQLAEWSTASLIPLAGPNCLGLLHAPTGVLAMNAPLTRLVPGRVGVVTQSGAIGPMIASLLFGRDIGATTVMTVGNEAALDIVDFIAYLVDDAATDIIGCFAEQIRRPHRFVEVCDAAADRRKPVVMLKIGRSELARRTALGHTSSVTGSDDVIDAVFTKHGVTRVTNIDEMVETLAVFHQRRLPRGGGVATIHASGGIATLTSELASAAGLDVPVLPSEIVTRMRGVVKEYGTVGNPLDLTGQAFFESEVLRGALDVLASAPSIDIIAYGRGVAVAIDPASALATVFASAAERHPEVRFFIFATANGAHVHRSTVSEPLATLDGVPLLHGSEYALRGIASLVRYAAFQRSRAAPPSSRRSSAGAARAARRILAAGAAGSQLLESEAKQLLGYYGIGSLRAVLATDADEAMAAARRLGFPVALKVASRGIAHKTDIGGVVLDVRDADGVRSAYRSILERVAAGAPQAHVEGVLVEKMAVGGVEMLVGIAHDAQFGPAVTLGAGGTLVEVLRDTAVLIPPLRDEEVRNALRTLGTWSTLLGTPDRMGGSVEALIDTAIRVSELCMDLGPEVAELDINPLLVREDRTVALDALLIRGPASVSKADGP